MNYTASYASTWSDRRLETHSIDEVEVRKSSFILLPAAFLFLALVFQLHVRLEIVNSMYKLESLKTEQSYAQSNISELGFALEKLYMPDFVVRNAKNKLGLEVTPPQRIRRLK